MTLNAFISMAFVLAALSIWGRKEWSSGSRIGLIAIALFIWLISMMIRPIAYFFIGMCVVGFVVNAMLSWGRGDSSNKAVLRRENSPWEAYGKKKDD